MRNMMITLVSIVVLIAGLVVLVTPVPIGAILIAVSLSMLVCVSPFVRKLLRRLRIKSSYIDRKVYWLEEKMENNVKHLSDALARTRPSHCEQKDDL